MVLITVMLCLVMSTVMLRCYCHHSCLSFSKKWFSSMRPEVSTSRFSAWGALDASSVAVVLSQATNQLRLKAQLPYWKQQLPMTPHYVVMLVWFKWVVKRDQLLSSTFSIHNQNLIPLSIVCLAAWRWSDWATATSSTGTSRCSARSATRQPRPGPPLWMKSWVRWATRALCVCDGHSGHDGTQSGVI